MANYAEALDRVRQQTERNYADREEGGGAIQGVFTGILNELNKDLDPANVGEPLSVYGQLLDSVVPFKQKQIEDSAKLQARLEQAKFTAGAPLRAEDRAEELKATLERDRVARAVTAENALKEQLPTLQVDEESNKEFIRTAIKNNPSLAATIVSRNAPKNKHLFRVFDKGAEPGIEAGEKIYTDEITGRQLYSTGDKKYINLNYHHSRLGKTFRDRLIDKGFSPDELRKLSFEDREKLFSNKNFRDVLKQTVDTITPELLQSHEIYQQVLEERTADINTSLKNRSSLISQDIAKYERDAAKARQEAFDKGEGPEYKATVKAITDKLTSLREKRLEIQLDGRFQQTIRAMVHRKAFALSLLKKQKVSLGTARVNINTAIQLSMNDEALKRYKKELQYYYGIATGKVPTGSTSTTGASDQTPLAAGHGKVPSLATNKAQRLLPSNPPETPGY